MSVTNPAATNVSLSLFAFSENFQDLGEPDNNTLSGDQQLSLSEPNAGALELIGDVDYFQVNETGTVIFDGLGIIEMVASVHNAAGQQQSGPHSPGSQFPIEAGECIRVEAVNQTAAVSNDSAYYLTLGEPPVP